MDGNSTKHAKGKAKLRKRSTEFETGHRSFYKKWMSDIPSKKVPKAPRQTQHNWRASAEKRDEQNVQELQLPGVASDIDSDDNHNDPDQGQGMTHSDDDDGSVISEVDDYHYELPDEGEEELEEEDHQDEHDDDDASSDQQQHKIYAGARISIATSMLLIVTFVVRHGLSGAALLDLLSLIEIHCLSDNLCKTSLRLFRRYFENCSSVPLEQHHYCSKCEKYLEFDGVCDQCHQRADHFVVCPLSGALQNFFARDGFVNLLKYPLNRVKQHPDNIEDVYDGQVYQENFKNGYFRGTPDKLKEDEIHLSFQMNTDGVALFKSSKSSVWPVFLVINELHPKLRFSREYRMLCGMWFGESKPNFSIFMKPFSKMLTELYSEGIKVRLHNGVIKTVKGLLLSACFDSPARCLFQNFIQFNGKHGCGYCLAEGKTVKTSERGTTQTYPYNVDDDNTTGHGEERTHVQTCEFADEAERGGKRTVMGVKGRSCFLTLPKFDIIRCVPPDYMHGSCLGVFKMLMGLWFDISNRLERFSIRKFVKSVDKRLALIKPPNLISRPPQLIETHIKWWKASEYRSFFLYYAIPCMYGILPNEYFEHLLLFVNALHILLSSSISKEDLQQARIMLQMFCAKVSKLYKPRYNTSNMHSLVHYCKSVSDLGPLYLNSCFWYEDFNSDLRHLFHGTHGVENQILSAIAIDQQIPSLASTLQFGSQELELYNRMKNKSMINKIKIGEPISHKVFVVGAMNQGAEFVVIVQHVVGHISQIQTFKRISMSGIIMQCRNYDLVKKRNTYTVSFNLDNKICYGQVLTYIKCYKQCPNPVFCNDSCMCHEPWFLAIVDEFKPLSDFQYSLKSIVNESTISHMVPVSKNNTTQRVISVITICKPCVWMDVGLQDVAFIGIFPNHHEKD